MFFKKKVLDFDKLQEISHELIANKDMAKFDKFLANVERLCVKARNEEDDETLFKCATLVTDTTYLLKLENEERRKYLPICIKYYYEMGQIELKNNHSPKAKLYLLQIIKLRQMLYEQDPNNSQLKEISLIYDELGHIYIDENDKEGAIKYFRLAFEFADRSVRYSYLEDGYGAAILAQYNLAKLGDDPINNIDKALNSVEKLLDEYPDNKKWQDLKTDILEVQKQIKRQMKTR